MNLRGWKCTTHVWFLDKYAQTNSGLEGLQSFEAEGFTDCNTSRRDMETAPQKLRDRLRRSRWEESVYVLRSIQHVS